MFAPPRRHPTAPPRRRRGRRAIAETAVPSSARRVGAMRDGGGRQRAAAGDERRRGTGRKGDAARHGVGDTARDVEGGAARDACVDAALDGTATRRRTATRRDTCAIRMRTRATSGSADATAEHERDHGRDRRVTRLHDGGDGVPAGDGEGDASRIGEIDARRARRRRRALATALATFLRAVASRRRRQRAHMPPTHAARPPRAARALECVARVGRRARGCCVQAREARGAGTRAGGDFRGTRTRAGWRSTRPGALSNARARCRRWAGKCDGGDARGAGTFSGQGRARVRSARPGARTNARARFTLPWPHPGHHRSVAADATPLRRRGCSRSAAQPHRPTPVPSLLHGHCRSTGASDAQCAHDCAQRRYGGGEAGAAERPARGGAAC